MKLAPRLAMLSILCLPLAVSADPGEVLPAEHVLRVTARRPAAALEHPLVRDVWQAIESTPTYRVEQSVSTRLKVERGLKLLETSLGKPWRESLDHLVSNFWLNVNVPAPGRQPDLAVIVESRDSETLTKFVAASLDLIARENHGARPVTARHSGHEWFQFGDIGYAVQGRYLLFASRVDILKSMLDLADKLGATAATEDDTARVQATLNLVRLKDLPPFAQALKWPTDNSGLVTILGGYVDLLREAKTVSADLQLAASEITLSVEADAGTDALTPGLKGFFTGETTGVPTPLLEIPGTLASSSWVRDYTPLWTHRGDLLTAAVVEAGEKEYDKINSRYGIGPNDVTQSLGTHWRAVIARQGETVYRNQPPERLPAAAVVVDLRDEVAFTSRVFPVLDKLSRGPITLAVGYNKTIEYKGAKLTSVRVREPDDQPPPSDYRYSVSPAMTTTRGHFIVGSTEAIVQQVIDELDRQANGGQVKLPAGLTEFQRVSFRELATLTNEFRDVLLRQIVLEGGLTVSEAEQNIAAAAAILNRLGEATSSTTISPTHFHATLRIGAK